MHDADSADAWPLGIRDPVERASRSLVLMEQARTRMEELAEIRARAVYELYRQYGGSKAARLLGMSRMNLYRLIGQLPEVHQQRVEGRLQTAAALAAALSAAPAADSATYSRSTSKEGGQRAGT